MRASSFRSDTPETLRGDRCVREAYKPSARREARKVLVSTSRLGYLERLILEYAINVARTFTPSDIAVYACSNKGICVDSRRVYDAIQRLVKRGFLVKVKRGWYRLAEDLDLSSVDVGLLGNSTGTGKEDRFNESLSVEKGKETGCGCVRGCVGGVGGVFGVVSGWVRLGVVRLHSVSAGGVVGFFFELVFLYYVLVFAIKGLESYLRRCGFSRRFIRRVRSAARYYALSCYVGVIGAHGRYGVVSAGTARCSLFSY
jgi:hypothetical protein